MDSANRYPLDALLKQRMYDVDARALELRERIDQAQRAELLRHCAIKERCEHDQRIATQTQEEMGRIDAGHADVQELVRLHAWRAAQASHAAVLDQRVTTATGQARLAKQSEDEARLLFVQARAGAKVIERHRERFRLQERRTEERKAEADVDDLVNARFVDLSRSRL